VELSEFQVMPASARRPRPSGLRTLVALAGLGCPSPAALDTLAADPTPPVSVSAPTLAARSRPKSADLPTGPRSRPPRVPVHSRDEAMAAAAAGQPEAAIAFLGLHLAQTPDDYPAAMELVHSLQMTGQLTSAVNILHGLQARLHDPLEETAVLRALARIAWIRGDAPNADSFLTRAMALQPNELANHGARVALLHATGRADSPEAKHLIDGLYDAYASGTVTTENDMLAVAQATLATGTHGGFKDANIVLSEAEVLAPASEGRPIGDTLLLVHAELFRKKYATDEAQATLDLILARDAFQPDALCLLARTRLDRTQLADASNAALEVLLTNPTHPNAHALLAYIAMIEGRRDEATATIRQRVLPVNPHHRGGLVVLAAIALFEDNSNAYAAARDAALALNPKDADFYVRLSDALGFLHLYSEADTVLKEGLGRVDNGDPFLQSAFGLNALRLGDEQAGRTAIDQAWMADRSNERTLNTRRLYSERIDPHYSVETFEDLTLRLPTKDRKWVQPILLRAILEARTGLDRAYGIHPSPIRVEIFDHQKDFSIRTVGVPNFGALGVCFGNVITILGPYGGKINFNQVIWHELAHAYAIELSGGRVPRWFTEGLSEWESEVADPSWARESADLLRRARLDQKIRALHDLELAFLRAQSPKMMETAYATAAYAMRYLGQRYGREKIIQMLKGYRQGKTTEQLFVEVYGRNMQTMEAEFETWFAHELGQRLTGWWPSSSSHGHQTDRPTGSHNKRERLWGRANDAMAHNDLQSASRALEELIATGGDGYPARMLLARVLMAGPGRSAAVKHLRAATVFNQETTEALVLLAELHAAEGDIGQEMAVLETALKIDAMNLEPAARLLMLAMVIGDDNRQTKALWRLQALAPLHPITLAGRAAKLASSPDRDEQDRGQALLAKSARTLTTHPGPAATSVVAAMAAEALGDRQRMKTFARRALESDTLPKTVEERMRALAR